MLLVGRESETMKGTEEPREGDSKDPSSGKTIMNIRIGTKKQGGLGVGWAASSQVP